MCFTSLSQELIKEQKSDRRWPSSSHHGTPWEQLHVVPAAARSAEEHQLLQRDLCVPLQLLGGLVGLSKATEGFGIPRAGADAYYHHEATPGDGY